MPDTFFDAHYEHLQDSEALHAAFLEGSPKLMDSLSTLRGRDLAKAWIIHKLEQDFLKCTIEDKRIDDKPYRAEAARLIRDLLRRDDWLTEPLVDVINVWSKVAQTEPIPADAVAVTLNGSFEAKAWLARVGDIALSDTGRPLVPVFEQSISDPVFSSTVVRKFIERVVELRDQLQIDALCFIEKEAGPIGLITAVSSLVVGSGLPATIYREGLWSRHAQFSCYQPQRLDRILITYDLNVTGNGLKNVARRLQERFGCQVVGAVVLLGYNKDRQVIEFDSHHLNVSAFGWYDETLASEVENIRHHGARETRRIRILADDQTGAGTLPPQLGGETLPSQEGNVEARSSCNLIGDEGDATVDALFPYWMFACLLFGGLMLLGGGLGILFLPIGAGMVGLVGCLLLLLGVAKLANDFARAQRGEQLKNEGGRPAEEVGW